MSTKGEFYRVAKPHADEYPVVEGTRCVQVKIPDDTSFLPVLMGMVAQLGNTWATVGGVEARRAWSQMWQKAYAETDWSACMNCEDLIACLTPLFEAQTEAIINLLANMQEFGTSTPGLPYTPEELEENIAGVSNPECSKDILWAQCLALIQFTNRQIEDMLEKIESATNVVELAGLSDDVPMIGLALKFFGVELATNAINYWQEALQEGYLAEYTEAVENELACQLFCACFDDCTVTLDRVYAVMYSNVIGEIPDDPVDWLNLLLLLTGIDLAPDTVVKLAFWMMWGSVKLASVMFNSINPGITLQQLLALAVNDASSDWLILCDCGADWNYQLDSTTDPVWVTFPGGQGEIGGNVIVQTTTVQFSQDVTGIYIEIEFPTVQHLTGIRINALDGENIELIDIVNSFWAMDDTGGSQIAGDALPVTNGEWEIFTSVDAAGVKKVRIAYVFLGTDQTMVWQPVQLFGFGVNPFI